MQTTRDDTAPWYWLAVGATLTVAIAIRIRPLGSSLFEDEVWLAILVRNGGMRAHTWAVPPLFYWIMRGWTAVRGFSDVALREPAAIFGVLSAAVPLFAPRPRLTRFVWSAMLAFSSPFLFYSGRLKQYTLEGFVATVLIVLFLRVADRPSPRRWVAFFAVAMPAAAVLHTPVFIAAAAGAATLVSPRLRSIPAIAAFVVVAAITAGAYVAYEAPGPATALVHGNLDQFFIAAHRWVDSPASFAQNSREWVGHAFNLVRFAWMAVALLALIWTIAKRDVVAITLCVVPPLLIAAASVRHIYPYGEVRLLMFAFPALYLVVADSVAFAATRVPPVLVLLAPFVVAGISGDTYNAYMGIDDLRSTYATVMRNRAAGEPIYADPSYAAPLSYYYPSARADLRPVRITESSGPGWYVQTAFRFTPRNASLVIRTENVVAARIR